MHKFAALAMVPLFAGFLCAQQTETHTTTTKTTTWNGTLVDAGCRTTHTEHRETNTNPDQTTTKTERSDVTDCPVTSSTTSFGLLTSDGQFVRFDEPSNTKVVQMVKTNRTWSRDLNEHKPITVRVVGSPSGDVVVVESIK